MERDVRPEEGYSTEDVHHFIHTWPGMDTLVFTLLIIAFMCVCLSYIFKRQSKKGGEVGRGKEDVSEGE